MTSGSISHGTGRSIVTVIIIAVNMTLIIVIIIIIKGLKIFDQVYTEEPRSKLFIVKEERKLISYNLLLQ